MLSKIFLKTSLFSVLLFTGLSSLGCPLCPNPTGQAVRAGIIHVHFWLILGSIFFIFTFYSLIVVAICRFFPSLFYQKIAPVEIKQLFFSTMLLSAGFFGLLDGIIFHQVLQLHSMISNILPLDTVPNLEISMFWDGIFHIFSLSIMLCGIFLTVKAMKNTYKIKLNRLFLGTVLLGGGVFNLVEGMVDHQILSLHHVVQRFSVKGQFYSDALFLLVATTLIIIGTFMIRKNRTLWRPQP